MANNGLEGRHVNSIEFVLFLVLEHLLRAQVRAVVVVWVLFILNSISEGCVALVLGAQPDSAGREHQVEEARQDRLLPHVRPAPEAEGPNRGQVHAGAARRLGEGEEPRSEGGTLQVPRHERRAQEQLAGHRAEAHG